MPTVKQVVATGWGKIVITGFLTAAGAGMWQAGSAFVSFLYDLNRNQDMILEKMSKIEENDKEMFALWRDSLEQKEEIAILRTKVENLESLGRTVSVFSESPEVFDMSASLPMSLSLEDVEAYRAEQKVLED